MYTILYVDPHPLVATFVAVTGFTVSGNRNANFTAQYSFDVPALKALTDSGCIESLKVYSSFPIKALDVLP